jgi:membrane-bound serine protease (ClpP class)
MSLETIITLIVAGLLLIFCEIFVPGGVLGGLGAIALAVGLASGFIYDVTWGFGLMLGTLVVGMVGFWLWVKYFPRSAVGKKLFLSRDAHDWQGYDGAKKELLGKQGVAHTPLRPAGTAIIEGVRVDVVSRGEMIERKSQVKVIEVEGNRVVVTKA